MRRFISKALYIGFFAALGFLGGLLYHSTIPRNSFEREIAFFYRSFKSAYSSNVDIPSYYVIIGVSIFLFICFSRKFHEFIDLVTSRFTKISVFGAELELSEQAAGKWNADIRSVLNSYRTQTNYFIKSNIAKYKLSNGINVAAEKIYSEICCNTNKNPTNFRMTVHVPDYLHYGRLIQLLEYMPRSANKGMVGKKYRTFSQRFGIIGLAWRLGKTRYTKDASLEDVDELIKKWGMKLAEAEGAKSIKSAAAIVLRDSEEELTGIVYIDAKDESAFGDIDEDTLERIVLKHINIEDVDKISLIWNEARRKSPTIEL